MTNAWANSHSWEWSSAATRQQRRVTKTCRETGLWDLKSCAHGTFSRSPFSRLLVWALHCLPCHRPPSPLGVTSHSWAPLKTRSVTSNGPDSYWGISSASLRPCCDSGTLDSANAKPNRSCFLGTPSNLLLEAHLPTLLSLTLPRLYEHPSFKITCSFPAPPKCQLFPLWVSANKKTSSLMYNEVWTREAKYPTTKQKTGRLRILAWVVTVFWRMVLPRQTTLAPTV